MLEQTMIPVRKPRGRPRKETADDSEARRARGRRAQQDFHRRKQAMFATLESHVQLLEDTIESMSTEFLNLADRLLQSAEISKKSPLLQDLKGTMNHFLDLTRHLDGVQDLERLDPASRNPQHDHVEVIELDADPEPTTTTLEMRGKIPNQPFPTEDISFLPSFLTDFRSSWNVGLPDLRDHVMRSTSDEPQDDLNTPNHRQLAHGLLSVFEVPPSADVMSVSTRYMIGQGNSFATQLFSVGLEMSFQALRGDLFIPGFVTSNLRYRLSREPPHLLMFMMVTQLEKMRVEYGDLKDRGEGLNTEAETLAVDLFTGEQMEILKAELWNYYADFIQDGGSVADWLDAWQAYAYMRERWNLRLSATAVMIPNELLGKRARQRRLSGQLIEENQLQMEYTLGSVQGLIRRLILDSMCLGDGPRFTKPKIDEAVIWLLDQHLVLE